MGEFGIIANVLEADRVFRNGAKVWLCGGTGGEGWRRFQWRGCSRGGRPILKWAPTMRFIRFRAAWVPPPLQEAVWFWRGDRCEMERLAGDLEIFAAEERAAHPGRRAA